MWCVQLNTQTTYYLLFKNIPWDWDRLLYLEIECFVTVTVICLLVCLCMIERLDVWSSYCVIATETLAGSEVIFVIQFSSGVCSCAEHWIKKVCLFTCDQMTFVNKRWILPSWFYLFWKGGTSPVFWIFKKGGRLYFAMHTCKFLLLKEKTVPYRLKG